MSELLKKIQKKGSATQIETTYVNAEENYDQNANEEQKEDSSEDVTSAPVKSHSQDTISSLQLLQSKKKQQSTQYEPSTWQNYFDKMEYLEDGTSIYIAGDQAPIFIFLHGAGHSGLSFSCLAQEIKKFGTLISFDLRGHGNSKKQGDITDLSIETLINDTLYVLEQIAKIFPEHLFIIGGHSLGGAVAAKTTEFILNESYLRERIQGLIVIDVVEGTALEALPYMENIVLQRPKIFKTLEEAIKWNVRSNTIKNLESAKVSVPAQFIEKKNENEEVVGYQWKVDLMKSQKHWKEWFKGLTKSFLNIQIPKILALAGSDRMDTELTISQMQGKFRLVVFHNVGHVLHEDDPLQMANVCYALLEKFKLPRNFSELETLRDIGIGKFKPDLHPYVTTIKQ